MRERESEGTGLGRGRELRKRWREELMYMYILHICIHVYLSDHQLDEEDFRNKLKTEEAKLRSLLPPEEREEGREAEGGDSTMAASDSSNQAGEVAKQMAVVQYLRVS